MALQPWRTGRIIRIENYTHNTRRYWIEVPDTEVFDFIPGQFVTLDLPISEKANKRLRSYSIASWPDGTNVFELLIVLTPNGIGTHYLFNETSIGSEIVFRGAQGVFQLPETLDRDLLLICTGTGVAPFRSMVHHILLQQIPHRDIHLVFGCRHRSDLLYYDEFKKLEQELPGFHYYPTLSRENWEGEHGYVHPIYERIAAGKPEMLFYLCGWKNMIDEAKKRILEMGYEKKAIHLELYG
jgi:CDP-4-dehydro-6-deoxyglucose reductase